MGGCPSAVFVLTVVLFPPCQMLAHLGEALDAFAVDNQNDREGVFADLLPAVLEAEASLGCRWRQVVAVLESFPSIVGHVSSDQV
jgi:hypothetical protein